MADLDPRLLLLLSIAPWVLVLIVFSSAWVALHALFMAAVVTGVGILIILPVIGHINSPGLVLVGPAIGVLIVAAILSLSAHLGVDLEWVMAILCLAGISGLFVLARKVGGSRFRFEDIQASPLVVITAAFTCGICFLPCVLGDAVQTADGGFRWMYPDSQFFMAIASSLKSGIVPPRMPGLAVGSLNYHIGAQAITAGLSAMTGIELGDSMARVVRAVGQWSLVMVGAGLGTLLGCIQGNARFAGPLCAFGLVFSGSATAFFADLTDSASYLSGAVIFELPFALRTGTGFDHFMLGHSGLWGLIGLLCTIALLIVAVRLSSNWEIPLITSGIIAITVLPSNVVAGTAAVGLVSLTAIITWRKCAKAWIFAAIIVAGGGLVFWNLGYGVGGRGSTFVFDTLPIDDWYYLMRWVFFVLCVKIIALAWLRDKGVGLILAVAIIGLSGFTLVFKELHWRNDLYGLFFLEGVITVFACATLAQFVEEKSTNHEYPDRADWVGSILIYFFGAAIVFAIGGFLLLLVSLAFGSYQRLVAKVFISASVLVLFFWIVRASYHRFRWVQTSLRWTFLGIGLLQSFAWVVPYICIGQDFLHVSVYANPGEVYGLQRLREISTPGQLIATNRSAIDSIRSNKDRSYMYAALSERSILLEGWEYGERFHPLFNEVHRDNELLFSTHELEVFKHIVQKYKIDIIVARPGTDIHLEFPVPVWIQVVNDTGSLRVYKVTRSIPLPNIDRDSKAEESVVSNGVQLATVTAPW